MEVGGCCAPRGRASLAPGGPAGTHLAHERLELQLVRGGNVARQRAHFFARRQCGRLQRAARAGTSLSAAARARARAQVVELRPARGRVARLQNLRRLELRGRQKGGGGGAQ